MLSLRICRYSMDKLIIVVFKMVKSVKFIRIKGPREARPPGNKPKSFRGRDLTVFEQLPVGGGGGMVTLGADTLRETE